MLKTSQKVVVRTVTVMRPLKVAAIARISDSEAIQSRAAPEYHESDLFGESMTSRECCQFLNYCLNSGGVDLVEDVNEFGIRHL